MAATVNYPDILGAITKGARANIGPAQVALATRPAAPRAGRPFELIIAVQNATDTDLDVTVTLTLPDLDARKQKARFTAKAGRVVAAVKPAEVGYIAVPIMTEANTAPAQGYKLSADVEVKPLGKPQRLRAEQGGGAVETQFVPGALKERIMGLRALNFSAHKRLSHTFDLTFDLAPGKLGEAVDDTKSGWVSVCKVSDYTDDRYLLHRYGSLLQIKTLPQLKRTTFYEPLLQATTARFQATGYAAKPAEVGLIAKLLTLILEYASPRHTGHGHIAAGVYNVDALIARDPFTWETKPYIPNWTRAYISYIEKDARAAEAAVPIITKYIFDDLLRDAIDHAFELIEKDTGEDVGAPDERANYREKLLEKLKSKQSIDFSLLYLPLVMGGMIVSDVVMMPNEDPSELFKALSHALEIRMGECAEDDPIFIMSVDILSRTGQKYGIKLS
ncbi:MAG: hypothetical protein IPO91_11765 [Chloroflexi bacterium]|nr:hypothetical protein [Chloroflexota bacterium]